MSTPCSTALLLLAAASVGTSSAFSQTPALSHRARFCRATNARYNLVATPKTGYDFVPVVADDSLGFYVAYSARQNETKTDFDGTSCMYVLPLAGDEVLIFGGGYGDTYTIPGGAFFDADHDVAAIKEAILDCMERDLAATRIRFVTPHGHPDHITVAFIRALERAGFVMSEIAYHEGDRAWIESLPWQAHHPALFNVLSGSAPGQELLAYDSPLGRVWFVPRPGHTPGSIDLVLDVRGDPAERVLVLGSAPGGGVRPTGVALTLLAHGTAMVDGARRAEADVVAGSGVNRSCLRSLNTPKLGTTWLAEVDVSAHPGASTVFVLGTDARLDPGRILPFGELLVDPRGRVQIRVLQPVRTGVTEAISVAIPQDPQLVGRTSFVQAMILGGGREFCNAQRLVIGF